MTDFSGLTADRRVQWSHALLNRFHAALILEAFAGPPKPPPTRRERLLLALREAKRRLSDAWQVLRHGAEIDQW